MSKEPRKPKPKTKRRRWGRWLASLVVLLLVVAIAGVYTVRSEWFANKVRDKIISEVEKASGGRTEVGSFQFDWRTMTARVDGFTLHGTEGPAEAPLLRAARIQVGIGITSIARAGVHVRSIKVDQPAFHLIATSDGKTNLPAPRVKHGDKDVIDTLLTLGAAEIVVRNGWFNLNEQRVPLNLVAKDVDIDLKYNSNRLNPSYFGDVASKELSLESPALGPMTFAFASNVAIEQGTINVSQANLKTKGSTIEVRGFAYRLRNPSTAFDVNATVAVAEFAGPLHVPIEHRGVAKFAGKVSLEWKEKFNYVIEGRVQGNGLGIRQNPVAIENAGIDAQVKVTPAGVVSKQLTLTALGGTFKGSADFVDFRKLVLEGAVKEFSTAKVLSASGQKPIPYVAVASGPVKFSSEIVKTGLINAVLKADIELVAATSESPEQIPFDGLLNVTWNQAEGTIELNDSHVATAGSDLKVSGTLGRRVEVTAHTTRLSDIQALLTDPLPLQLKDGSASFQGSVIGPLDNPRVEGQGTLTHFTYEKQTFDTVTADFSLTREMIEARSFSAAQGPFKVDGSGSLGLQDWKASERSPLIAKLIVRGAQIEKLLTQFKQELPVTGALDVTANLHGTINELLGDAQLNAVNLTAWDETIDRIKATVKLSADRVELADASAIFHKSEVPFSIVFTHAAGDWKSGAVSLNAKTPPLDVTQIRNVSKRWPQWKGTAGATVAATGSIADGNAFHLKSLNGDLAVRALSFEDRQLGTVDVNATSTGSNLNLTASANVRGSRVKMTGAWQLEGTYPGGGEISASSVTVQTLRELFLPGERAPLPFQSAVEAGATFKVPLNDPSQLTADVKIQRLFFAPGATQRLGAGAKEQDLILENARPIIVHVTPTTAVIEPAAFHATNTNIEVAGKVGFESKQGWDLTLKGGLNLGQLQMFRQDLLASGNASIDATVHGTITDPQVNGSLVLSKASLYFGDLPIGLDNVNGSLSFDRNRATIQTVTAESGGGKMSLTGFVGFGGVALVYRLQGNATGVRVRYPEGASTTVNANVSLTGTSRESLLAGTVTVVRAAFTPRSDLGSLMAELTKPGAPVPPQDNDYIRGMQLDVRIESAPNLEFQTSLTRGLEAEVDLRLRGTAARPTLLGNVGFSDGEISLFGNKYTLNRGDIRFFNPTRIEPVFDIEAETKARGIDVNISFSGTPSKLNASYRSDPPLQPSDIIALLAIGRDPNVAAGIASSQVTQQGSTAGGLGNIVGQAVASSVTDRLQKFFGVTKIKIDPQLTGLDNIPQARLTLEQQLSQDITLTYITNLARTQEQIVRIQWDLSKQWSGIAVRDENGLFGVDVQYKKRFK